MSRSLGRGPPNGVAAAAAMKRSEYRAEYQQAKVRKQILNESAEQSGSARCSGMLRDAGGDGAVADVVVEGAGQVIKALEAGLKDKGIAAKVIYSGGADVDVLAAGASKGEGLKFLLNQVSLLLIQIAPEPDCLCLTVGESPLHPTSSFLGMNSYT